MRRRSVVELALLGSLLVGAASGPRALAQDANVLRRLEVDDYPDAEPAIVNVFLDWITEIAQRMEASS